MRLFGVFSGEDCLSGEAASSAARHRKAHLFDDGACSRFFLVSSFCPHRKKKIPEYPLNIQLEKVEKIDDKIHKQLMGEKKTYNCHIMSHKCHEQQPSAGNLTNLFKSNKSSPLAAIYN